VNIANLRATNTELQDSESRNVIHEPIVERKILPSFQEISFVSQINKEVKENKFFTADIPQFQIKAIISKDILEDIYK
jgi:hypothetical protein